MIVYNYETDFQLDDELKISNWIQSIIEFHNCKLGEINYIFCDDNYLHKLNVEFLNHDTLTDIISFDNSVGKLLSGDIFVSIERVKENAIEYKVSFLEELNRVMIHGILHFIGFKDKLKEEKKVMRLNEDEALSFLKY